MARLIGILLLVLSSGCQAWRSTHRMQYQTIQANPHRDTKSAVKATGQAAILIENGNLEKAERCLQEALIADVRYGPAHCNLGQIYYLQGKYYLSAWEFEYASKLMPNRPEPLNNLGLVFERVSRFEDAIGYYESARELDPRNPEYIGNLARVKFRRDDKDEHLVYLLRELLLYETRPDWRKWAEEQFALVKADIEYSQAEGKQQTKQPSPASRPTRYLEKDSAIENLPAPKVLNAPHS